MAAGRVADRHRLRELRGRERARAADAAATARRSRCSTRRDRRCCRSTGSTRAGAGPAAARRAPAPAWPGSRRATRPKFVLFGESLGAWTSQDPFVDHGTQGLVDTGIDHAIWIGTPHFSKWKEQVLYDGRPDVDPSLVARVQHDIDEWHALDPDGAGPHPLRDDHAPRRRRRALRPELAIQAPGRGWARRTNARRACRRACGGCRRIAFFQVLVDMKNSATVVPGQVRRPRATTTAPTCCRSSTHTLGFDATDDAARAHQGLARVRGASAQRVDPDARRDGQEPRGRGRRAPVGRAASAGEEPGRAPRAGRA